MRVRYKILLVFSLLGIISLLSYFIYLQIKSKQELIILQAFQNEHNKLVFDGINALRQNMEAMASDYAIWDEMADFAIRSDSSWSNSNLSNVSRIYGLSGFWVFDRAQNLKYCIKSPYDHSFTEKRFPASLFDSLRINRRVHYFDKSAQGFFEVAGHTIHATKDTLLLSEPSGYLLVAKPIDKTMLNKMENWSRSSILLKEAIDTLSQGSDFTTSKTLVELKLWDGTPAGYLQFSRSQPLLASHIKLTRLISFWFLIFELTILFLISVLLYFWIYRPLKKITNSLSTENINSILPLTKNSNEFGEIAFLIERFFAQKNELARVIEEKNDAISCFARAESKNATLLSSFPANLFRITIFGVISDSHVNHPEELPFPNTEVIGRNIEELFPAGVAPRIAQVLQDVNRTGRPGIIEFNKKTSKGHLRNYEVSISPTSVGDYLAVIRDTTSRKETELALNRMLERESELSRLKTHFLGTVSHEIRTPVSAISSNIQLLELYGTKWSAEKKSAIFDRIRESVNQVTSLLANLSMVARDQTERILPNPAKFNLQDLCKTVIAELELAIKQPGRTILSYALSYPEVTLDLTLVRYILNNLLSNALKFSSPESKVLLTLQPESTGTIRITVEDTGIGIPEHDIGKVFDPFHRAINATDYPGTGLGLSIVQRCIDQQNGSISVKSHIGTGTIITILLPIDLTKQP